MNSARIRTICSWLPTLDEARLREVEDFVLAKAIEQQDSAPADTVVPHDGERTHGGDFSAAGRHGAQRDAVTPLDPGHETPTGGDFTEAEYSADAARVVAHAAKTGRAVVVRPDGSPRVVISIPAADDAIESGLRELAAATPVKAAAPGVAMEWDMTDLDGDE